MAILKVVAACPTGELVIYLNGIPVADRLPAYRADLCSLGRIAQVSGGKQKSGGR